MNIWDSYVFVKGNNELAKLCDTYFKTKESNLLFIMGCGFDPRMNNIFFHFLEKEAFRQITCLLIDFPRGKETPQDKLYLNNKSTLENKCNQYGVKVITIKDAHDKDSERRIIEIIRQLKQLNYDEFSDIVVDVSAMPRAIYFNICKCLFNMSTRNKKNLFFSVSENIEIDASIVNIAGDEIYPIYGFGRNYTLEANWDKRTVLIPLLGEHHIDELEKIFINFKPVDVCPILPFPSINPRRAEEILVTHMDFFRRRGFAEPQNYTYADERNPFELYLIIRELIKNYQITLKPITDCVCFGIAALTSKLMSLGALLVGLEQPQDVSFYTSSPVDYQVENFIKLDELNKSSETFLMWITGEAYDK